MHSDKSRCALVQHARAEFRRNICWVALSHLSQGRKSTTDGTLDPHLNVCWDRQAETDGGSGRNGPPSLVAETGQDDEPRLRPAEVDLRARPIFVLVFTVPDCASGADKSFDNVKQQQG
jgi:hypothetical protein